MQQRRQKRPGSQSAGKTERFLAESHFKEEKYQEKWEDPIREINPRAKSFPLISFRKYMDELSEFPSRDIEDAKVQSGLIGEHPEFRKALYKAAYAAETDISILFLGKTGTGKELFARFR